MGRASWGVGETVPGAEDPCYFPKDPMGFARWYCLHPEKLHAAPVTVRLQFPKWMVDESRAKFQAEKAADAQAGGKTGLVLGGLAAVGLAGKFLFHWF